MRSIYYFLILGIFLLVGLTSFLTLSCGTDKVNSGPTGTEVTVETGAVDTGGIQETEGQDLILAAYRDPALRDGVIAFFLELAGSREVAVVILANSDLCGIPPALAFSLCAEESGYNSHAINHNRNGTVDRGLFQLNSSSFPKLSTAEFYNPGINAYHGLAHLRWCLDTAGTEVAGLAMYNAGTTRVRSEGTPKGTLDYISRILGRQKKIEEQFEGEYLRMIRMEIVEEKPAKTPFRLSLLTPLGGR